LKEPPGQEEGGPTGGWWLAGGGAGRSVFPDQGSNNGGEKEDGDSIRLANGGLKAIGKAAEPGLEKDARKAQTKEIEECPNQFFFARKGTLHGAGNPSETAGDS